PQGRLGTAGGHFEGSAANIGIVRRHVGLPWCKNVGEDGKSLPDARMASGQYPIRHFIIQIVQDFIQSERTPEGSFI
ncbi:MAG: hypothetical protein IJV04_10490, partial [Lachnospiraceae bacterium]|nr:hypothetical protein [Lachnospiraceae bacterium]